MYYAFVKDRKLTPYEPVAIGVCVDDGFSVDACVMADFIQMMKPADCPKAGPSAPRIGGLNCGPDNVP
jgi:hypothetical protein